MSDDDRSLHQFGDLSNLFERAERSPVVLVNRGQPRLVLMTAAEFRRLMTAAGEPVPSEAMPRQAAVVRRGEPDRGGGLMDDVREGLPPQWQPLYDLMVAAGHVPLTRRWGRGSRLVDEWVDGGGLQAGVMCAICAHSRRLGQALPLPACDGHGGKVRRLRERADVAKASWEKAERAAAEAEGCRDG